MEASDSLTVETHIFSVALRYKHWFESFGEVSDRFDIFENVSTCKSLISWIEERNKFFLLHHIGYFFPIWGGRVNSCGVVSTGMEQDNVILLSVFEERDKFIDFDFFSFRVVVRILFYLKVGSLNDILMVGPSWRRNQNFDFVAVKFLSDKLEAETKSTGSWKWLNWADSTVFK